MDRPLQWSRREFIAAAGMAAVAGSTVSGLAADEGTGAAADGAPQAAGAAGEWFDRPMRWVQLVLAENDPGNYDQGFWLDLFRRVHADATCLSAGGCVAYYPTKIEHHHRSAWMKDGTDPFGDLVAGCRKLGMVVVARTDPHSIRDEAAAAHPEWVAVDAQGNK